MFYSQKDRLQFEMLKATVDVWKVVTIKESEKQEATHEAAANLFEIIGERLDLIETKLKELEHLNGK